MAIQRNRRNLRGYGLAQDPTTKIDYGFVDDQNQRQAQDKSIAAQEASQQRSFAQRDKESKLNLLGKLHTVKQAWSPELKNKLDTETEEFVKNAGDESVSGSDIILGLTKLNSKIDVYNKIGEQASKNLSQVLAGKTYASKTANKFANQELEEDFAAMDTDQALAAGMSILNSEFAPMPDPNQIQQTQESLINVAKKGEPTIEDFATLDYGKKVYKEKYGVPEEGRVAAAQNIYQGNQRYYDLFARDNGMNPDQIIGTIYNQMPTEVYGASTITDVPRTPSPNKDNLKDYNPVINEKVEATEFGEKKSLGVALPSDIKTTIKVGKDITEGTVDKFKVDENGKIKAVVTYRVPSDKSVEGAPTYSLKSEEVDGEQEFKKLKSKYPKKAEAIEKAYNVASSAKEKASETVDFAEMAKGADVFSFIWDSENEGGKASQKIIDKLKEKGIDIKDEDKDPWGDLDLKFTVNGNEFKYDFTNEADIKRLQKDYENGFKVEKESGKATSTGGAY